ncbi:MbtH family protein [Nonomuraea jabiensis]|uniref:MbtH family protein n=1 Tax=Nonomuraea jabiensis TaxID=882448 RepID=UPI003D7110E4
MSNPFEDEDGIYFVLVNDEGQHSLWPKFANLPSGWSTMHGPDTRAACLAYVEANWRDMRPKSLTAQMDAYSRDRAVGSGSSNTT